MAKKKVSRQRLWQMEMIAQGRCSICGKPAATKNHCTYHAEQSNKRCSARYRGKHGITGPPKKATCSLCGEPGHYRCTCMRRCLVGIRP